MTPDHAPDTSDRTPDEQPNRLTALPLFSTPAPTQPAAAAQPGEGFVLDPAAPTTLAASAAAARALKAVPSPPRLPPAPTPHVPAMPALEAARHPAATLRPVPDGPAALPAPLQPPAVDWDLVRAFRQQAAERLTTQLRERPGLDEATRQEIGRALIVGMLNDHADTLMTKGSPTLTAAAQHALSTAIFDSLFGLGRLQPLVDDPYVENIEIRGFDNVLMLYGDGVVREGPPVADNDEELIETLAFLAARSGRAFTQLNWVLDLQLHGGARLAARAWQVDRPTVVIRVHRYTNVDLSDLLRLGMIDEVLYEFLKAAVRAGKSIVVAGGQGAGKTTLVRALCNEIPEQESIITIETERELHLQNLPGRRKRVASFDARPGSGERGLDGRSAGEVTLEALLVQALRLNADRIIVGEVRGPEVLPMLKAAQAARGTLSTTHAYSARAAIERLATCALEAGPHVTTDFAYRLISSGVDLIVQVGVDDQTHAGGRKYRFVSEVIEVTEGENGRPAVSDVFAAGKDGRAVPRTRPTFLSELTREAFDVSWLDQVNGTWGPFAATPDEDMRERR